MRWGWRGGRGVGWGRASDRAPLLGVAGGIAPCIRDLLLSWSPPPGEVEAVARRSGGGVGGRQREDSRGQYEPGSLCLPAGSDLFRADRDSETGPKVQIDGLRSG